MSGCWKLSKYGSPGTNIFLRMALLFCILFLFFFEAPPRKLQWGFCNLIKSFEVNSGLKWYDREKTSKCCVVSDRLWSDVNKANKSSTKATENQDLTSLMSFRPPKTNFFIGGITSELKWFTIHSHQLSLLILSDFEQINSILIPLTSLKNHGFSLT